jgi:hypothetical protein
MTSSRTRRGLLIVLCAAAMAWFEDPCTTCAWISDVDTGVIAALSDDTVYMQGQQGVHVFQLMGICSWCEEGADLAAVFEGLTHATLAPYPNYFGKPPVRALVVKDGREEF